MVLPGIQALFGFQLIAVFNQRFVEDLSEGEQRLHFVAIALIVVAIGLIMSPAALHRHLGVERVSETFLTMSTRLLLMSMLPLALAIGLDFYLIAKLVVGEGVGLPLAIALVALYVFLWWIVPRSTTLRKLLDG
jgi:hypothetical protein